MGVDVPDWQRQIYVNTDIVANLPINIDAQTLGKVLVRPDYIFDIYKRKFNVVANTSLTTGQTKEIINVNTSGVGFSLRVMSDSKDAQYIIDTDGSQILTGGVKSVWETWGGVHYEEMRFAKVTQWDIVNNIYTLVRDYGYVYPFATNVTVKLHNAGGSTLIVKSFILVFMETR